MSLSVEQIYYYPLTGAAGISLDQAVVNPSGIEGDRNYLLYDENYNRVGAKQAKKLLGLTISVVEGNAFASFPGESLVELPKLDDNQTILVNEFGDMTPCHDLGLEVAEQFSEYLGMSVRLAHKSKEWTNGCNIKPVDRQNSPIHIVSEETVEYVKDLAESENIDVRRFRPNIVLSGTSQAEIEQSWPSKVFLRIGRVAFQVHRGTQRCAVTGYNPDTSENLKDVPKVFDNLKEVSWNGQNKAAMGVYAIPRIHRGLGINLNDPVTLHYL